MGIVRPQATHKGLELKLLGLDDFPKYARGDQQRARQVPSCLGLGFGFGFGFGLGLGVGVVTARSRVMEMPR